MLYILYRKDIFFIKPDKYILIRRGFTRSPGTIQIAGLPGNGMP